MSLRQCQSPSPATNLPSQKVGLFMSPARGVQVDVLEVDDVNNNDKEKKPPDKPSVNIQSVKKKVKGKSLPPNPEVIHPSNLDRAIHSLTRLFSNLRSVTSLHVCCGQDTVLDSYATLRVKKMLTCRDPEENVVSVGVFCQAFPFHFMVDRNLRVIQIGRGLVRILGRSKKVIGHFMNNFFLIEEPPLMEYSYKCIVEMASSQFIVQTLPSTSHGMSSSASSSKSGKSNKSRGSLLSHPSDRTFFNPVEVEFRGQMIPCPESHSILFVGSPIIQGMDSLTSKGLFLSDLPFHDMTREKILVAEQTKVQEDLKQRMILLRHQINQAKEAVEKERKKTVTLLYQMFPPSVAQRLWEEKPVGTINCHDVTMVFARVVDFNYISIGNPMVTINTLDELFTRFDKLCDLLDVYKWEATGGHYSVVSGLHRPSPAHAHQAAFMALRMMSVANSFKDSEGHLIQMRIGIHSGSFVAGVVGHLMPRYRLFGQNVSIGRELEEAGELGKINVSRATYNILSLEPGFHFDPYSHGSSGRGSFCSQDGDPSPNCYILSAYHHPDLDLTADQKEHITAAMREILVDQLDSAGGNFQSRMVSFPTGEGRKLSTYDPDE